MDPVLTLKLQNACQEPLQTMSIEERLGTVMQKLTIKNSSEAPCNLSDANSSLALQLCELVDVAAKMTQLDGLCAKAAESVPVSNPEARKWQELSLNAMHLSREALAEQQRRCVQKLAEFSTSAHTSLPVPVSNNAYATAAVAAKTPMPPCPQYIQSTQKPTCPFSASVSKKPEQERGWNGTLRTHLSTLQNEDSMCVLIVRRINRLGFESDEALKEYFTKLGRVRHVLVAHSRVKPSAKRPVARVRPAGIGFVVMETQEETNIVLAQQEHVIRNISVQVCRYETRCPIDEDIPVDEDTAGFGP